MASSSKSPDKKYKNLATAAIHAGQAPNPLHGAVTPGIELSTTYAQPSPGVNLGFEYSRSSNPTRVILETLLASLENGKYCQCFASGSAATATVISTFLKTGQHMVSIDDVYGGTNRFMRHVAENQWGYKVSMINLTASNGHDLAHVEQVIRDNGSKLLWIETPTNPTLSVADIRKLCAIAKKYGCMSVVDNTFATPYNQKPLDLGADMVVHSITKYLNGHSDVVMGCAITNCPKLSDRLKFMQNAIGAIPAPFDCYMVIRGIKTLPLRMAKHASNALAVAKFLENHSKVESVFYPHLRSHPNYSVAIRQMRTGGGMVTFFLKGGLKQSRQFLENVSLMHCAESLGAVETLVEHPAIMTHASVPPEERKKLGISDTLIRVSVGVEELEDILADLRDALACVKLDGEVGKSKL